MRVCRIFLAGLAGFSLIAGTAAAQSCAAIPGGLVSWWPGEGDGADLTGGNSGTLLGATTFTTGSDKQAFKFGGLRDAITVGNPENLRLQSFTIEAWVARSATSLATLDPSPAGNAVVFGYGAGGYVFGLFHDGRLYLSQNGVSFVDSGNLRVTDMNFHHIAVSKSGTTVVFYVDGMPQTAGAYDPGFQFNTSATIGAANDNLIASFLGVIDELSIYDHGLTAAEVQSIFAAGPAGKCAPM